MDLQTIINIGAGFAIAAAGWFARQIWEAVKELREDIHRIEIELPTNYIRRDEFADNIKEVKEMLRMIFDKLDDKADKH